VFDEKSLSRELSKYDEKQKPDAKKNLYYYTSMMYNELNP
jgi:hypothetical protein